MAPRLAFSVPAPCRPAAQFSSIDSSRCCESSFAGEERRTIRARGGRLASAFWGERVAIFEPSKACRAASGFVVFASADGATRTYFSPSKVNLFLRIIRRREDGYHDLASLFQAIGLGDSISFTPIDGAEDALTCSEPGVPVDGSNLVLKAMALFRSKTGYAQRFRAHIEKRVPFEAGLGGGSANAATALWAMNELAGAGVAPQALADWGAEFGSDISFFLSEGTAYCTGRGEILRPLAPLPGRELYVVKPREGLSTGRIFKALDLEALSRADPEALLAAHLTGRAAAADYVNDLEAASFSELPLLAELKARLAEHFDTVLMSGSGTSFFCAGPRDAARAAVLPANVRAPLGAAGELPAGLTAALEGFPSELRCYATRYVNRPPGEWYQQP
eukprot:tig00021617_g22943.t1